MGDKIMVIRNLRILLLTALLIPLFTFASTPTEASNDEEKKSSTSRTIDIKGKSKTLLDEEESSSSDDENAGSSSFVDPKPSLIQSSYDTFIETSLEEDDEFYNEAIKFALRSKALNNKGELVDHKRLDDHTLYLLIKAYEGGHEKSKELLANIIYLQGNPFKNKKEKITDYHELSEDQKIAIYNYLHEGISSLFPSFESVSEKNAIELQHYHEQEKKILANLAQVDEELQAIRLLPAEEQLLSENLSKGEKLLGQKNYLVALQQKEHRDYIRNTCVSLPKTKTKVFENRVCARLILKFIAKIAVGEGEAKANPDWVNHLLTIGRAGVGIGVGFAPHGAIVSSVFNLVTGIGEAGYNTYQKKKTINYVDRFLELKVRNTTEQVRILSNILAPRTACVLTSRYENPLKLLEMDVRELEKLADYSVKLMIKSSWNNTKSIPQWKGSNDTYYGQIAEFLCDQVSYFYKETGRFSKIPENIYIGPTRQKARTILTKTAVVRQSESSKYYVREYTQGAADFLLRKVADPILFYRKAIQSGFRTEVKDSKTLKKLGFEMLSPSLQEEAKKIIEAGNDGLAEEYLATERKAVREFFKVVFNNLIDESPQVVEILKDIQG
jgi:hypothetical protein